MKLTKALKLLNKIDKGKISHYLQDCIDYEERNLGVMRKEKVYGLAEFYVDEAGESADEAVPLLDCRFWQKDNKGEITPASLTAGDILAKDWECVFVDACCDLNCTIREYLQSEYSVIMYRDEIAELNTQDLLKDEVVKIEIVDALRDKAIREYGIEVLTGSALLNFESVAKTLKKDLPYIVVCHKANGDDYELEKEQQ
ncbi:hypothetical protein [Helicobacter sp. MIT 01-3238]|uniref:hypothetical protein n=1 Tax=Helicobacter sp. MIT 01-3238 TaxID=398627 RepID=UPI000E1ECF4D|nr:hypothetical protein [Helicobacter sp. MIT 01-3238]RDU52923.1 hypothetical protein CQA40_06375 [Helicobacter sp. MIT 01-3238]